MKTLTNSHKLSLSIVPILALCFSPVYSSNLALAQVVEENYTTTISLDKDSEQLEEFFDEILTSLDKDEVVDALLPDDDRLIKTNEEIVYSINNSTSDISKAIALTDVSEFTTNFNDIANSEFSTAIKILEKNEVVQGTTPTTFEPNKSISRAEFLAIVMGAHGYSDFPEVTTTEFTDLKIGDWKTNVIEAALKADLVAWSVVDGKKVFKPNEAITKIEAMAILVSMRDILIPTDYLHSYTDAAANWQNKVLSIVEYLGLEVKSDMFNPNATITRGAMANYVVKATKLY